MFLIRIAALTLAVALAPASAEERVVVNPDRYAAIAYSEATGNYGYGYNRGTRREAERRALVECAAPDAKLLTWVQFGWAAACRDVRPGGGSRRCSSAAARACG